jgi:DNA modification methylase
MSKYKLIENDCIAAMRDAKPESVHAIVCDPPYGIEFMGKSWDSPTRMVGEATGISGGFQRIPAGTPRPDMKKTDPLLFQEWCTAWAEQALRVLKPGGHIIAFGGTRMFHRLAAGIEDAGFEIRDTLMWMYGSGFPKSHNVSKSIDKLLGTTEQRKVVSEYEVGGTAAKDGRQGRASTHAEEGPGAGETQGLKRTLQHTTGGSAEARAWDGWGTALKPAYEPIILARKPLRITSDKGRQKKGTVAQNVLEHGTGAINIDESRIATDDNLNGGTYSNGGNKSSLPGDERSAAAAGMFAEGGGRIPGQFVQPEGRFPANVILDEEAGLALDEQSGTLKSGKPGVMRAGENTGAAYGAESREPGTEMTGYGDSGGASRFFYCAKTSPSERKAGLQERSNHPTMKPIALMEYLVRLVTAEGQIVLDPFMGSGSTGIAALQLGRNFVGIEREPEYMDIARARIAHWAPDAQGSYVAPPVVAPRTFDGPDEMIVNEPAGAPA